MTTARRPDGGNNSDPPVNEPRRKARVFDLDDVPAPAATADPVRDAQTQSPHRPRDAAMATAGVPADEPAEAPIVRPRTETLVARGFRWGSLFLGAVASALALSAGLWFWDKVSTAAQRADWIGWTTIGLIGLAALALVVIVARELRGFYRVGRLTGLRRDLERARTSGDAAIERAAVERLVRHFAGRPDLDAARRRINDYASDIHDPGQLLLLADRELLGTVDGMARRTITASAKRVFAVTAMAPFMFVSVGFVFIESLRLMTQLATLYGGRPGWLGGLRLARLVLAHVIATGAVGLTDDLVGQFLGQDFLRRISRRLGEAAFNGAFSARMGAAALDVIRPLPYIAAKPVRARDIVGEVIGRGEKPPAV